MTTNTLTDPFLSRYDAIKLVHPEHILFFRRGDFYEMYHDDAHTCADELEITLVTRCGVPMSGVPFHSVDGYIAQMIDAGHQVAICEMQSISGVDSVAVANVELIDEAIEPYTRSLKLTALSTA